MVHVNFFFSQDTFGFCFVEGIEATPEATESFIKRMANIRETQCLSLDRLDHFILVIEA
jgi:hypothetical protein